MRRGPEHDAVSPSKLTRRLRREVTTNPKKAAVLGLLVVVALWFWAPLVWGWITPDDSAAQTTAAVPAADTLPAMPTGNPLLPGTTPKKVENPRHAWQELVEWMDHDPRTLAASTVRDRRDPFVTPKCQVVQAETEPKTEEEPQKVSVDVTPESLGMVLSGTIIGPHRRVARIDGKSYQQGDTVIGSKDGQPIEFRLAQVYPRRIILNQDERQFELKIPSPDRRGRIKVLVRSP